MRKIILQVVILILLSQIIITGETDMQNTNKFTLEDIQWIAGSFRGEGLGGLCEEIWTPVSGNSMTGVFRLSTEEKTQVIEFLIIEKDDDKIIYRFKHYDTKMKSWEDEPLTFILIDCKDYTAVFESPKQVKGEPKQLIYKQTENGDLKVQVVGWSDESGTTEKFEVNMARIK